MLKNTIHLKCVNWEAAILPSFGANLISLRYDGKAVLREPESLEQLKNAPELYGNPLLFPPNRTKNGIFSFEGKNYNLPVNEAAHQNHLHGYLHRAPFETVSASESSAVCRLKNDGAYFPFPFIMEVSFTLTKTGMEQRITIINNGSRSMPVLLGFHTSFVPEESFAVPIGKRWERDEHFIPTGMLCELSEDERKICSGTNSEGKIISGYYTSEGRTARIGSIFFSVSSEFSQWILYNQGGQNGIVCVEPQTGCVNGLNIPGEHLALPAGDKKEYWLRFTQCKEEPNERGYL